MQKHRHDRLVAKNEHFPTETAALPESRPTEIVDLGDGNEINLKIAPVAKRLRDASVRMLAYNGSIPGPTLRVPEGSEVIVNVANEADLETTVHWHGLRLENAFDGTHETQAPIAVGGTFSYRVQFPDPGIYWYHPHIREDYGQEMGLYANILVVPADPDYWPPAHREVVLTLDDVLIEDGKIAPFGREETNYAAMGRFGNLMLVGGETDLSLSAQPGEVVRFYVTNTANTRVFNMTIPGARMKLVGGDSGRYEREAFVDAVMLAPSERAVIDVLFARPERLTLEHRTPDRTYSLATIDVGGEPATPSLAEHFEVLRHNREWVSEREWLAPYFDARPDKTLALVAEMDMGAPEGPAVYGCPMHADVVRDQPGRCPKCWMKLLAIAAAASYACPMHPDVVSENAGRCPKCWMKLVPAALVAQNSGDGTNAADGHADRDHDHHAPAGPERHGETGGIEWEDDMVAVNRITTPANMHWRFVDRETGAVNHAIEWRFRVGDRVKLRLVNEMDSDHPMHHPFHIHGAGRFVVLARDGVSETNLVWKDTVLVRAGETVDILLNVTNPGVWMAHCHIAEHHESGMMFSFSVAPARDGAVMMSTLNVTRMPDDTTAAMNPIPELDVLVIGAGQAGLATGYHLKRAGLRYQLLDGHARVGDSWRQRFDSLKLFTPRSYSALPELAVPGDPHGFPSKDEIADYLEAYAAHFAIPIRLSTAVRTLEMSGAHFRVTTNEDVQIASRAVVIATGAFQIPNIPAISAAFSGDVHQLSADTYHRPSSVPAGTVLVVGDGATGRQIALELAATHKVLLSMGRARRVTPDRVLGRSIFWWLDHCGLLRASRDSWIGRKMRSGDPFPGSRLALPRLRQAGVRVVPRLSAAEGTTAHFADGAVAEIRALVWATGYRVDSDWLAIPAAKSPDGAYVHSRGVSPIDGVYFVGQSWQWTRGSALLTGVGADAAYVTEEIARSLLRPDVTRHKSNPNDSEVDPKTQLLPALLEGGQRLREAGRL